MKHILVTGINGFIGRNIPSELISKNDIIGCGRQNSPARPEISHYIQCELGNKNFISSILNSTGTVDTIIHCAASLYENSAIIQSNCQGITQILDLAKQLAIKKIIFLSSIPVIGKPVFLPITEEHPLAPMTVYHASKIFGENTLNLLQKENIQVIILRISSPIGIDMDKSKIFSVFIENCMQNKDLSLSGEGKRIQNYIHVRDIWQAISLSLDYKQSNVFNIAHEISYSNYELAQLCIEQTHSRSKIQFTGKNDPEEENKWIIDISKAKQELNFKPQISLETSIREKAEHYANTHCQ